MSLRISLRGISKNSLSPTRCTLNMPFLVMASAVITLPYGRGAAGEVLLDDPVESPEG